MLLSFKPTISDMARCVPTRPSRGFAVPTMPSMGYTLNNQASFIYCLHWRHCFPNCVAIKWRVIIIAFYFEKLKGWGAVFMKIGWKCE